MASSNGLKPALFLILCSLFLYIDGVPVAEEHLIERSSAFAHKLYDELLIEKPNENIIFSPFSIETCIAMARMGAQGKTAEEMDAGLGFPVNSDATAIANVYNSDLKRINDVPYVNIANRIYVMSGYKIKEQFNEILSKQFYSEAKEIDFGKSDDATKEINSWVETKTNDRIKNLVSADSLSADTRLVLVNAVHFKANWEHKFDKVSRNGKFYLNENDHVTVPMMNVENDFLYGEIPELDAKAIELPYTSDSGCSLYIVLPNSRTGLNALEEKLKDIPFNRVLSKMSNEGVKVKLPKFKAEFSLDLNEPLKRLGMKTMFSDEADFSKMLEAAKDLKISNVIHKAFIEVNEEGTEAAAATGILLTVKSARDYINIINFTVDKPFLYFIRNANHKVIFAGKIIKF